ncbi:restriction endonuclease [Pusillimonas sp. ANT_WB101]|uniref:restriction endonuclease n=1 Tax=Pusillimonas sp. ANT_WB101 TaxID=2597356 RepID=UPI0011ECD9E1|nr:restriction endonuclease [Pusillimonas sp. ANT_WB101]KAA0892555.1 restriction endonuclease [Pusillimonas sp. ANT_WB101]
MPVPTYDQFIEPIFRYLAINTDGAPARVVHEAAADTLGLTLEQRQVTLNSGQAVYKNRAGWAYDRLKRAGFSDDVKRGHWKLNNNGIQYVQAHPAPLSAEQIEHLAVGFKDVRLRAIEDGAPLATKAQTATAVQTSTISPDDLLDQAWKELREATAANLLESLSQVSPTRFEVIVLDVLHRLGYGANRNDLQQVGGSGDGGIDGVISLDKLGLEKVYVQAKRWQGTVGRPDLQAFYGALAGQKAKRGVFITTSGFSAQAIDFGKSVEGIVLVDGLRLVNLMMDYEVGVTSRSLMIPKIDTDYFDED